MLIGETELFENLTTRRMLQELLRHTDIPARDIDIGILHRRRYRAAGAAVHAAVLQGDHQTMLAGQFHHMRRYRQHPPRIDDRNADPLLAEPVRCRQGCRRERPDRHQ
ncbi:Uncharacterised protein [Mycobacteroides abscessus]|nr:Uncharacterised protein [Mycobacteroides abscessus]